MDRINIYMQVPRVENQKPQDMRPGESSTVIRIRVEAARERQRTRFESTDIASNADMRPAQVGSICTWRRHCSTVLSQI